MKQIIKLMSVAAVGFIISQHAFASSLCQSINAPSKDLYFQGQYTSKNGNKNPVCLKILSASSLRTPYDSHLNYGQEGEVDVHLKGPNTCTDNSDGTSTLTLRGGYQISGESSGSDFNAILQVKASMMSIPFIEILTPNKTTTSLPNEAGTASINSTNLTYLAQLIGNNTC